MHYKEPSGQSWVFFLVGDFFVLESKGSVRVTFLLCGVSESLGGMMTRILMMSAIYVSFSWIPQCLMVMAIDTCMGSFWDGHSSWA